MESKEYTHEGDQLCPKHSFCRVNNGNPDAIMHFCGGDPIDDHDTRVIQRYKEKLIGITAAKDGLKLCFDGSAKNAIRSQGEDSWGIGEAVRLYAAGREAWLKGDFETVAELFGVLV